MKVLTHSVLYAHHVIACMFGSKLSLIPISQILLFATIFCREKIFCSAYGPKDFMAKSWLTQCDRATWGRSMKTLKRRHSHPVRPHSCDLLTTLNPTKCCNVAASICQ